MLFWTEKLLVIVAFEVIAKGVNISVAACGAPSCLIPLFTQIVSGRRIPTAQHCWLMKKDDMKCSMVSSLPSPLSIKDHHPHPRYVDLTGGWILCWQSWRSQAELLALAELLSVTELLSLLYRG
jgi:hypothetical protein